MNYRTEMPSGKPLQIASDGSDLTSGGGSFRTLVSAETGKTGRRPAVEK